MPKPEIGIKRQCTHCGAKFFDLMKSPIVCPKCGTVYEVASMPARSSPRGRAVEEEEDEQELQVAEAELSSIEEAPAADDEKVTAVPEDDIEVEEDEAAEDDTFLQKEEEHSEDVSTLKDGEVEGDEEEVRPAS
jgi:uncharacterized protein (TIGR02300 family)